MNCGSLLLWWQRSNMELCPDPSQIQSNPSHWHSQKIHFNICHPSVHWVLKWSLHLSYFNQNFAWFFHLPQTSDHVLSISSPQYNHRNNNVRCYSLYRWLFRKRNTCTYQVWYMFPFPSRWFNDLSHVIFLRWLLLGKKSLQTVNLSSTAQTLFTDSSTVKNKDHLHLHQQNQDQYTKKCQTYTATWQKQHPTGTVYDLFHTLQIKLKSLLLTAWSYLLYLLLFYTTHLFLRNSSAFLVVVADVLRWDI